MSRGLILVLLLWLCVMTACRDQHGVSSIAEEDTPEVRDGEAQLLLTLTVFPPDAVTTRASATTRTEVGEGAGAAVDDADVTQPTCHPRAGETYIEGLESENAIYSLTLFLVDLDDNGAELITPERVQYVTLTAAGAATAYEVTAYFKTTYGRKHLYVGANLRPRQIRGFIEGNEEVAYTGGDFSDVMGCVMDFDGERFAQAGSNISMFSAAPLEFTVSDYTTTSAANADADDVRHIDLTAMDLQLERTVGKVLLACLRSADEPGLIARRDVNELSTSDYETPKRSAEKYRGWAPLEDVYYVLNVTSRRQRLYGDSVNTFGDNLNYMGQSIFAVADLSLDSLLYVRHFADEISFTNSDADIYPYITGLMRRRAIGYDLGAEASAIAGGVGGLYCLPNLFRFSATPEGEIWYDGVTDLDNVAQKKATYLSVAVRYVPKSIVGLTSARERHLFTFTTMEEALDSLPAVQERDPRVGTDIIYPQGTFWTRAHDGVTDYFTYEAMMDFVAESSLGAWAREQFNCYQAGYGYYTAFVDCQSYSDAQKQGQTLFGVSRNHYYVLRTDTVAVPGASAPSGIMRLNAVLLDWQDQGLQEVVVTPGEHGF